METKEKPAETVDLHGLRAAGGGTEKSGGSTADGHHQCQYQREHQQQYDGNAQHPEMQQVGGVLSLPVFRSCGWA